MKVRVLPERCQGHNLCASIAPSVFEIDDFGHARARASELSNADAALAGRAGASCPEHAIVIESEGDRQ